MKEMKTSFAVFLAAMLGGVLRYEISLFLPNSPFFPWATLLVNYIGTFVLVFFVKGYLTAKNHSETLRLALGTGFCGGLTTFSGLLLDVLKLADAGRYNELILYLLFSIAGGLLVAFAAGRKWGL